MRKDEKVQVGATNNIRGEMGSTIDKGELSLLGEFDFYQLSLASIDLDDQMILRGIDSSERKRLPERTAHFVRKFDLGPVPIGCG